jgi:hypothetical protein
VVGARIAAEPRVAEPRVAEARVAEGATADARVAEARAAEHGPAGTPLHDREVALETARHEGRAGGERAAAWGERGTAGAEIPVLQMRRAPDARSAGS